MAGKKKSSAKKSTKKQAQKQEPPVAPLPDATLGHPPVPEGTGGTEVEYTVGQWAGKMQYRCKLCPFDCLNDEVIILNHLINQHNSEAALEKLLSPPAPEGASPQIDPSTATVETVSAQDDLGGTIKEKELEEEDGKNNPE